MDPEFELVMIFCPTLIFQVLYYRFRGSAWGVIVGVIAAVGWMATAQTYLLANPNATSLALFFQALFMVQTLLTLYSSAMVLLYGEEEEIEEVEL